MTERDAHCSKKKEFCSETLWLNVARDILMIHNIFSSPVEVAKLLVEATDHLKKLELKETKTYFNPQDPIINHTVLFSSLKKVADDGNVLIFGYCDGFLA